MSVISKNHQLSDPEAPEHPGIAAYFACINRDRYPVDSRVYRLMWIEAWNAGAASGASPPPRLP